MGSFGTFLSELRRRKVWLVGGVYVVAAWIIAQVASLVLPSFAAPGWVMPVLLIVLGLGLPLAIILAWAQETQAGMVEVTELPEEPSTAKGLSIAVLPFDNLSGEEEFGYLADGLVDEIITILAQNPRFFVIARNTMFTYKGQAVNVQDVGRELGVAYVIEGSVRKSGEQMRINVQLIEAATGAHAWSERFIFDVAQIFDIQDQMIEGIAGHLGDQVLAAELTRLKARPTEDLGAWELYIRTSNWRKEGPAVTAPLLRQALARDPEFAAAMATLAIVLMIGLRGKQQDQAVMDEALALAERALLLAPDDPLVMTPAANALAQLGQHERAIKIAEAALLRAPGDARCHALRATIMSQMGEGAEALKSAQRTLELSPHDMAASTFLIILGHAELQLGNLEAALEHVQKAERFSRTPEGLWGVRMALANILALSGELDQAREVYERCKRDYPLADLEGHVTFVRRSMQSGSADLMLQGLKLAGIIE